MPTVLEQLIQADRTLVERTRTLYLKSVTEYLGSVGSDESDWTVKATQAYYDDLLGQMQPQSANAKMIGLRYAARRFAEVKGEPGRDFAKPIALVQAKSPRQHRALTRQEGERLLVACDGRRPMDARDYAMVSVCLLTGMLRSSLVGVNMEDFGIDDVRGSYVEVTVRGGRRHRIPVSKTLLQSVEPWLRWLRRNGVTAGAVFRGVRPRVSAVVGDRLTEDGFYRALKARAKKARIRDFNPNILCHTFVAWSRAADISDDEIAAVMGTSHNGVRATTRPMDAIDGLWP